MLLGFVTLTACSLDSAYACSSDAQCTDGLTRGRCEADGYCSFVDDTCPSGRRFGVWAPSAIANDCVDNRTDTTSTPGSETGQPNAGESSTTTATAEPSSGDPTTTFPATLDPTEDPTTSGGEQGGSSSGGNIRESSSSGGAGPLDPDLIAWYRFDAFEDASFADHSGNSHTATCKDCPTTVDGVFSSAMQTDGVGQHLVVANAPAFETQMWTLATWVWSEGPPASFVTLIGKPVGVGFSNSYELGLNSTDEVTRFVAGWSDDDTAQSFSSELPASQQWFHVAATLSETTATLYLDGAVVNEQALTVSPAFDDNSLYIGADLDLQLVDNFFAGRMDDVRIYGRALDADEVAAVMAGESP